MDTEHDIERRMRDAIAYLCSLLARSERIADDEAFLEYAEDAADLAAEYIAASGYSGIEVDADIESVSARLGRIVAVVPGAELPISVEL